jgi:hypothetical protein
VRGRSAAAALALACGQPQDLPGCATLRDPGEREACRWALIAPLADDDAALDAALAQVAEPESRDLLLLRLALSEPRRAPRLCARVSTPGAVEKCQQVLGRPHLGSAPRAPAAPPGGPR